MLISLFILLALMLADRTRQQPEDAAPAPAPTPTPSPTPSNAESPRETLRDTENPQGFDRKSLREQIAAASELYEATKGGLWGIGTEEQSVLATLRNNVQQIDQVRKIYNDHFEGRDFDTDILGELSGASRKQAELLLRGDLAGANGAGLEDALPKEAEKSAGSAPTAQSQSEVEALRDALTQVKDVKAVEQVFAGKSNAEAAALVNEYSAKYDTNFFSDIDNNFAGRNSFEIRMAARGQAAGPEEEVARLHERQEFERSGVSGWIMDTISSRGAVLDRTVERADAALEAARGKGDAVSVERASQLAQYGSHDVRAYGEAKDSAAELTATAAAGIAGAGAIAITGGAATPLVVGSVAAAGGAATYAGTKAAVEGNAYELTAKNVVSDVALGAVEGVATVTGAKAAKLLAKGYSGLSAVVVEGAVDNSLSSGLSEAGDAVVRGEGVGQAAKAALVGSTIGAVLGSGGGAGTHSLTHGVGKAGAHEAEEAIVNAVETAERAAPGGEVAIKESMLPIAGGQSTLPTNVGSEAALPRSVQNALAKTNQVDEALASGDTKAALKTMQRVEESLSRQIDTLSGKGEAGSLGAAHLHRATGEIALKRAGITGDVEQFAHASDAYLESLRVFSINGAAKSELNAAEMGLIRARDGMRKALSQLDDSEAGLAMQASIKSDLATSRLKHGTLTADPHLLEQSAAEFNESAALYLQVNNMDASMSARRAELEANATLARLRESAPQTVETSPVETLAQIRAAEAARGPSTPPSSEPIESAVSPDIEARPGTNEIAPNANTSGPETAVNVIHAPVESSVTPEMQEAVSTALSSYRERLAQKTGLSVLDEVHMSVQTGHVDGFMKAEMNLPQLSFGSGRLAGTRPTISVGLGLDDAEARVVSSAVDYGVPHEMAHLIDEELGAFAEQSAIKRGLSDLVMEDVRPALRSVEEQLPSFPDSETPEIKRKASEVLALQLRETYYDGMGLNLAGTYGVTDPGVTSLRARTEAVAESLLATETVVPWEALAPGDVGRIGATANLLREVARAEHMISVATERGLDPELIGRLQGLRERRLGLFSEANGEFGYFTDDAVNSMLDGMRRTFNEGLQTELSPRWAVGSTAGRLLSSGGAADPASYAEELLRRAGNAPREELARWFPGGDRYESLVRASRFEDPNELERWLDVRNPAIEERVGDFFRRTRDLTSEQAAGAVNQLFNELRDAGWNPV